MQRWVPWLHRSEAVAAPCDAQRIYRRTALPNQPFSRREGLGAEDPVVYDDVPDELRYGLREVLDELGHTRPSAQRTILCKALRRIPDQSNWSEYPNVENEVLDLIAIEPWYKFFDAMERIPKSLVEEDISIYYQKMNALFAEERIGYRFESGAIIRQGTEEFLKAVRLARIALGDERFAEPLRQFERGYDFRNRRPADWANAIKEAVNSVEGVLQVIYCRPGVSLTRIISDNLPAELPGGIKQLFRSLYSQGSGTVGARHASIGGNEPTGPRAELALHVAASLHEFAVNELDTLP